MKRQKSRAGCMTVLFVTVAVLIVAGLLLLMQWTRTRETATEPAEPVVFPAGPVEPAPPAPAVAPAPTPAPPPPARPRAEPAPAPAAPAPAATAPAVPGPRRAPAPAATEPGQPPPAPPSGDADGQMGQARERLQAADYQGAREAALAALTLRPGDAEIEAFLSGIAMPLLASGRPMPEKIDYIVQRGDFLGRIAATYNTPVALIARANNIQGALIREGQTLRLFDGRNHEFAVEVSKSRNDLLLTLDGQFFKRYRVATGRDSRTPVGVFKITDKIAHPSWHKPGGPPIPYGHPDNLLGTHWLAIDQPGYGLHGTWEPESIGQQTSDGCIRLLNDDIEELYSILPRGTRVTITE